MENKDELYKSIYEKITNKTKVNLKRLFIVYTGPLLAGVILFLVHLITNNNGVSWLNHVNFWIFLPLIMLSLFYSQKNELAGAYGETILLLIPTFVWLLPGHNISIWYMIAISFALIIIACVSSLVGIAFSESKKINENNQMRIIKKTVLSFRVGYVCMALVSTLILSVLLILWADKSMGFANHYHTEWKLKTSTTDIWLLKKPQDEMRYITKQVLDANDYTQSSWIAFVSIVTIIVASGLVLLGLISTFSNNFKETSGKTISNSLTQAFSRKRTWNKIKKIRKR